MMAPNKSTISCKFFALGSCRNEGSCHFTHEAVTSSPQRPSDPRAKIPCRFVSSTGGCQNSSCAFMHETIINSPPAPSGARSTILCRFNARPEGCQNSSCKFMHEIVGGSPQELSDSRAMVPCKFVSSPEGCRNSSCPYLHTVQGSSMSSNLDIEVNAEEDHEGEDDLVRDLSGASVYFDQVGGIIKVSLPADFSLACITGLPSGTTPEATVELLRGLGFDLSINCIRIPGHGTSSESMVIVKVEDPLFARKLSTMLKEQNSALSATPLPIDTKGTNCRKVYISWHKATRSAWVNFGNGDIANRVAQRYNEGKYKCLGQLVRSSPAKYSPSRRGRFGGAPNPVAWTIALSDVPGDARSEDIKRSIFFPQDEPRHVELGRVSYIASESEVSVEVRSHLEKHGPLENFHVSSLLKGKRSKATACFQDEADARSACSLNGLQLDILGRGKLTVTLVQSVKIKVSKAVYLATKSRIDEENKVWKDKHLVFHVYNQQLYSTLKVEGNVAKDLADARRTLDRILKGMVLRDGETEVWDPALNNNGLAYKKVKSMAEGQQVVLIRDKAMRQLRFFGPPEKLQRVARQTTDLLREETYSSFEIDLKPHQLTWTIHGGFKSIEQALGKSVAVFNVVSRKIVVNGTQQQYETALAIMDGTRSLPSCSLSDDSSRVEGCCPICLSEPENPIRTSCKHTYCLECFEDFCRSAASTSQSSFQIKCQGDEGDCSTVFNLGEINDHVSSAVFEAVLKSSFEEYINRQPQNFRYCPTPDCGYVYRCSTTTNSSPSAYTCPNCFEPVCTSCHSRHGDYTCVQYKDLATGGYEALAKLKKELNIKDCPKCTTPIEKTQGCNHMACLACKAHICWVCMAVFDISEKCYAHMTKEHGGNGLGLERFIY